MTLIQISENARDNIPDTRSKDKRKGVVYVIDGGDSVKIGRTSNLQQRISSVILSSGRKVTQIAISPMCNNYINIETYLHRKFSHSRDTGEWFQSLFSEVVSELSMCDFDTTELPIKENKIGKLFELLQMNGLERRGM